MKLNMHIIKEDLGLMCSYSRISMDESLTLLNVQLLGNLDQPPKTDILYIATIDELKQYLYNQDILALVITGGPEPKDINININTNFITTSIDLDKFELFLKIQSIFEYYNRWESQVINIVFNTHNLESLLHLGQKVFGNPIVLFDTNMIRLAMAGKDDIPIDAPIWKEVLVSGHTDMELLPFFKKDVNIYKQLNNSKKAFIFTLPDLNYKCFHVNLFQNNIKCGSMNMTEIITPLTKRTTSIANHFSSFVTVALERSGLFQNTVSEIEQIANRILANRQCEDKYLDYILAKFNWNYKDKFRIFVIGQNKKFAEIDNISYLYYFQKTLNHCQAFEYNSLIILIQNLSKNRDVNLPDGLINLLITFDYYCGVSNSFYGFNRFKVFYTQAVEAFNLGIQYNHKARIFEYLDYVFEHIMNSLKENLDLTTFCHPSVIELHRLDLQNSTNYVYSLYIYLSCGKNLVKSAEILYIHRNTFVYRLNKILDVIGQNEFDKPNNTIIYILSCKIIMYLSSEEQ